MPTSEPATPSRKRKQATDKWWQMVEDMDEDAGWDDLKRCFKQMKALVRELDEETPSKKPKADSTPASSIEDMDMVAGLFGLNYHTSEDYVWDIPDVPPTSLSPEIGMIP